MKLAYLVAFSALACLASLAYGSMAFGAGASPLDGKWTQNLKVHIPCDDFVSDIDRKECIARNPGPENYISLTFTIQGGEVSYSLTTFGRDGAAGEIRNCETREIVSVEALRTCAAGELYDKTKVSIQDLGNGQFVIRPLDGETRFFPFARRARLSAKGELELEALPSLFRSDEEEIAARRERARGAETPVRWEAFSYSKVN